MTLREAAQALLEEMEMMRGTPWTASERELALRAALAQLDPDRWTAGAEAMREAAARGLRGRQIARKPSPARDALIEAEHFVRALPVPPATTPTPCWCEACGGEKAHATPAPSSKPAESEVGVLYLRRSPPSPTAETREDRCGTHGAPYCGGGEFYECGCRARFAPRDVREQALLGALYAMREWHRLYHGKDPCGLCVDADRAAAPYRLEPMPPPEDSGRARKIECPRCLHDFTIPSSDPEGR